MDKFYLPMETIRITQNYNGKTSHYNHSNGTPKDYPIDMAGADGGQSCIFAPTDMEVTAIKGVGNNVTNTIWLVSTNKVKTPTFIDKVFMTITHWNDNCKTSKYKVGDIIKKGEIIGWEGTDGATANHLHVVFGRGYSNSWTQNNKGSWVIVGETKKPEEVCYIYDKFSATDDTCDIEFEHTDNDIFEEVSENNQSFFDENGWFGFGDNHENIGKIAEFMYKTFPAYTNKKALGCYYGKYIMASIKEFQKRTGLLQDGNVGAMTLSKLKEYGFKY